ncbi:MAG: hypothetical protein R3254_08855, partial [Thiomicrorhabdus sp.]|nr:hypothetical protein [Thiomicrorhabdus sp.]
VLGIVLEAFAYLLKLILVMGAENANLTKKAWERIEYLSRYSHYHEMSKPKGDSNAKTNKELH